MYQWFNGWNQVCQSWEVDALQFRCRSIIHKVATLIAFVMNKMWYHQAHCFSAMIYNQQSGACRIGNSRLCDDRDATYTVGYEHWTLSVIQSAYSERRDRAACALMCTTCRRSGLRITVIIRQPGTHKNHSLRRLCTYEYRWNKLHNMNMFSHFTC